MAKFEEHCNDCIIELGEPFKYVHEWLDEFALTRGHHRQYRHHEDGVEEVRKKWGDRAARAAEIHIIKDFKSLGQVPTRNMYSKRCFKMLH